MNELSLELTSKKVDLLAKEIDILNKGAALEFERISKAFMQMGNLLDLLYLETSVLIEMLHDNKVIDQEAFTKKLEETAKKVEEQINKSAQDMANAAKEEVKTGDTQIEKL